MQQRWLCHHRFVSSILQAQGFPSNRAPGLLKTPTFLIQVQLCFICPDDMRLKQATETCPRESHALTRCFPHLKAALRLKHVTLTLAQQAETLHCNLLATMCRKQWPLPSAVNPWEFSCSQINKRKESWSRKPFGHAACAAEDY